MTWLKHFLRWGLPLYVFLLPWQTRYIFSEYSPSFPLYGDASLYATDVLFVGLFISWLIWFVLGKQWQAYKKHSHLVTGTAELVIGYAAISLIWSPDRTVALLALLRLFQAAALILMLATAPIRKKEVLSAIVAAGVVQGLLGLAQFFMQSIPANKWLGMAAQDASRLGASVIEQGESRWLRAYGGLPHPNILGGVLVVAALAAAYLYLDQYRQFAKEFRSSMANVIAASLASFAVIIIGLLFTFSRTAWMGFVVGFATLFIGLAAASNREQQKLLVVAAAKLATISFILLITLNALCGGLWLSRVQAQDRLAQQSVNERSMQLAQARTVIEKTGLKGGGIGSYPAQIMAINPGQPIYTYQPVHNVWLLAYAELGLAGLLLLVLWMTCWYQFIKSSFFKKLRVENALPQAWIFAIGSMAFFDHFWWTLPVGIMTVAAAIGLRLRRPD